MSTIAMAIAKPRRRARRHTPALVFAAAAFLVLMTAAAALAPIIAPYPPDQTDLFNTLAPPSPEHIMGTDGTGRDTYSRLLFGAQLSLLAPLAVVVLTTVLGAGVGLLAARVGGVADLVISRSMDIVFAFPALLLAMLSVAIIGPGLVAPICALAIAYIPFMGRIVRSAAIQEQVKPYVGSHAVMGFTSWSITMRHILPNITPSLLAQSTLGFGYAMLDLAALSYLGLGVQPPAADWGSMIAESQSGVLQGSMWSLIFPSIAVVLTVLAVNAIGEWISDRFTDTTGGAR